MRKSAAVLAMMAAGCLAQNRGPVRGVFTNPVPPRPHSIGRAIGSIGPIGHGFGNVVFPGTGIPNPIYRNPTTFAQRFGATMTGYPGYMLGGGPAGRRGFSGAAPLVPYAVPVLVGGGYGFGYGEPAPNVTIVNAPPPQPAVIINQHYAPDRANPVMRDYSNERLPEPSGLQTYQAPVPNNPEGVRSGARAVDPGKPTIYLIAFRDGTVYSAYAWWVEGGTLHYITTKYSHNRASVELIDIGLSEQLNSERGVEFKVPVKK